MTESNTTSKLGQQPGNRPMGKVRDHANGQTRTMAKIETPREMVQRVRKNLKVTPPKKGW